MRTVLDVSQMAALVEVTLENEFVAKNKTFTAWEVTQRLKELNPDTDIRHDNVRGLVHAVMEQVILTGIYDRQQQDYQGNVAWTYTPTTVLSTASPVAALTSWLPQLPDGDDD